MNVMINSPEEISGHSYLHGLGFWLTYFVCVVLLHFCILCVPAISIPVAWTLTNVLHNMLNYMIFHHTKGTPWESPDQGRSRLLTLWEQIDNGVQFTATRKFLTIFPIILFIIASFYTNYEGIHFAINAFSLAFVVIAKLPALHRVRLFNLNKY